jgi:hypothetical protein
LIEETTMLRSLALVAAFTFASGVAWAWATVSGTVISTDLLARTVTLDNGRTFTLPEDVSITDFHSGDKVVLSIGTDHGNVVSVTKA